MEIVTIIVGVVAAAIGAGIGVWWGRDSLLKKQQEEGQSAIVKASNEAKTILENSNTKAASIVLEGERKVKEQIDEADGKIARLSVQRIPLDYLVLT